MTRYEELVNQFGYIEAGVGMNDDGENVIVSIDKKCASVRTIQHNSKFQRVNIYYPDGTEEELYEH